MPRDKPERDTRQKTESDVASMSETAQAPLDRARYAVRVARSGPDVGAALKLRGRIFRGGAPDADAFDPRARHLVVRDRQRGAVVATCRVLMLADGRAARLGYCGRHYGLAPLATIAAPILELGRFCLAPAVRADPDVPRLMLAQVAALVEQTGARLLMGCSSFPGAQPQRHAAALAWLGAHALAPASLAPRPVAPETTPVASAARPSPRGLPPLLRSYLALGGRVSDHAVIDRDLDTLHVLTLVDTETIPPARKTRLRALAASATG